MWRTELSCPGASVGFGDGTLDFWIAVLKEGLTCWTNWTMQHPEESDRAQNHCSERGQRPAVAGPDVRVDPTQKPGSHIFVGRIRLMPKMRHTYLPLQQRQPKRAAGATMLMLSGALTSSSHCKGAAPRDSHGAALPRRSLSRFSRLSAFSSCVGKTPTASCLFTWNSEP